MTFDESDSSKDCTLNGLVHTLVYSKYLVRTSK